jgi:hypothetical protein
MGLAQVPARLPGAAGKFRSQSFAHVSVSTRLPSSHSSLVSRTPLPQIWLSQSHVSESAPEHVQRPVAPKQAKFVQTEPTVFGRAAQPPQEFVVFPLQTVAVGLVHETVSSPQRPHGVRGGAGVRAPHPPQAFAPGSLHSRPVESEPMLPPHRSVPQTPQDAPGVPVSSPHVPQAFNSPPPTQVTAVPASLHTNRPSPQSPHDAPGLPASVPHPSHAFRPALP